METSSLVSESKGGRLAYDQSMFDGGQRVIKPELLDHAAPEVARPSLADLVRINRYLGGYGTLRWMLTKLVGREEGFSLLDVGAASGDMGAQIRARNPGARIVSMDYKLDHLRAGAPPKVCGDAFKLPLREKSVDFVFSSLFLHHFEDKAVAELLAGFARVARRAVLAIDLERGPLAYRFIPATRWLFGWHPITLHDAPASVQAGFTADELRRLAEGAGLRTVRVRSHRPWGRLSLIAPVG